LRAVVQVALDLAARGVARLHDAGARGAQLLVALAQLRVEMRDVAAQQPAEERERHQPGGDERRPPGHVAAAGLRDRHEQERQQGAHVDRRELEPLELAGAAPVADRPDEHEREQAGVEERAERLEDRREIVVRPDQQHVLRAVLAVEPVRVREQGDRDEREREDQVAGDHERAIAAAVHAAGREADAEVQEEAAPQAAEHEPDRVDDRVVRALQVEQEPGEPERHHQRAGAVVGPLVVRVQAGANEAPADRRREDRPHHRGRQMVAREHQRDDRAAGRQRGNGDGHDSSHRPSIVRLGHDHPRADRGSRRADHEAARGVLRR
jgi:hypothetical protein